MQIYEERWWCIESEREIKRAFSVKEGEVDYSGTAEPCDMTQMHWCWRERERGGGWEERRRGVQSHCCSIYSQPEHTNAHTNTHLHTHTAGDATIAESKWLHINIQWKQHPQLPLILLLKTNGISFTQSSYLAPATLKVVTHPCQLAHTHTEWFRQYSASKPQIPKPAALTPSLIHDATSQLRA